MSRLIASFVCFALGAVALAALAVGWTALTVGHYVTYSLGEVNATLHEVNRPCAGASLSPAPCGTLADVAKTLNTIRGTAGQVEIAARHENAQLDKLDAQETQLYADLHSTILNVQGLTTSLTEASNQATAALHSANAAIENVQPVIDKTNTVLGYADAGANRLNTLLYMPEIPEVIQHADAMTASGDRILKDGADEADKLVHPPVKKLTFWSAIDGAFLWIHSHVIPSIF